MSYPFLCACACTLCFGMFWEALKDIQRFCGRNKAVKLSSRHRSGNLWDMGHSWLVLVIFDLVSCAETKNSFECVFLTRKVSIEL